MARRRSRNYTRDHDRPHRSRRGHGSRGRSRGGSTWWVWLVVVGAVIAWGSSNQGGGKSEPSKSPDRGGLSTVCTEYFRGGC